MLGLMVGCGLWRGELAGLEFRDVAQHEGRWAIVDIVGKHGRVHTVPMPSWTKTALDGWAAPGHPKEAKSWPAKHLARAYGRLLSRSTPETGNSRGNFAHSSFFLNVSDVVAIGENSSSRESARSLSTLVRIEIRSNDRSTAVGGTTPMPQLIPDGPDIPGELIQKQEAGEIVFFCGAGISVPTGLPSFPRLVERLYASLNVSLTPSEEKMIERGEFAEALGILESRITGNAMRSEVARLLSSNPRQGSLQLHRALLGVLRNSAGMHLVTTNYDDNFARSNGPDDLDYHVGPALPDLDSWNSVVHLHGRIQTSEEGPVASQLVLTGADFGEAYLTKRWAAEFISNLMDRYNGRVRWLQHGRFGRSLFGEGRH